MKIILVFLNLYPFFLLGAYIILSSTTGQARPTIPDEWYINYFLLYPFWLWVFLVVQCILLFFILELIKLILLPVYRKHKEILKNYEAKIILLIFAFFIIYVPARVIFDYNVVSTRIVEYKKSNLPDDLNNFRITFISDVQADAYTDASRLGKYIRRVNDTNPDLVLIGGDMITSTPDYIDEAAEYVGKIKSKYGVYSCIGDHDNWAYRDDYNRSLREVEGAMQKYNVEMFNNKDTVLNIKNSKIGITFLTSTYVEHLKDETINNLVHKQDHADSEYPSYPSTEFTGCTEGCCRRVRSFPCRTYTRRTGFFSFSVYKSDTHITGNTFCPGRFSFREYAYDCNKRIRNVSRSNEIQFNSRNYSYRFKEKIIILIKILIPSAQYHLHSSST